MTIPNLWEMIGMLLLEDKVGINLCLIMEIAQQQNDLNVVVSRKSKNKIKLEYNYALGTLDLRTEWFPPRWGEKKKEKRKVFNEKL